MSERVMPGPIQGNPAFSEAVCVQTKTVYDSCKDKECLSDLQVYFNSDGQSLVDRAINAKCKRAIVSWVDVVVEPVPFNRGFYTVDVRYYYLLNMDIYLNPTQPIDVEGLATFSKRVILYGGESKAKVFHSYDGSIDANVLRDTGEGVMPTGIVEVVEPIVLASKLREGRAAIDAVEFPDEINALLGGDVSLSGGLKNIYVTLGQFTIIQFERESQLLIPTYELSLPVKETPNIQEEDPYDLFNKIKFPNDEFFPPSPRPQSSRTDGARAR